MTVIWEVHDSRIGQPRSLRRSHADGESSLDLVHALLYFVIVDGPPDFGRPMLVKLVRVLNEQHLVAVNLEVAGIVDTDRHGVALAILLEDGDDLLLSGRAGRAIQRNVLDLQLLQWP